MEIEKIYLASSFKLLDKIEFVADILKDERYEITREWWHHDFKKIDKTGEEWYRDERVEQVCKDNFDAIEEADALVLVCPDDEPMKYNGANIELGYAHAKKKPTFAVGELKLSAMYVPVYRTPDTPSLLRTLKWYEEEA